MCKWNKYIVIQTKATISKKACLKKNIKLDLCYWSNQWFEVKMNTKLAKNKSATADGLIASPYSLLNPRLLNCQLSSCTVGSLPCSVASFQPLVQNISTKHSLVGACRVEMWQRKPMLRTFGIWWWWDFLWPFDIRPGFFPSLYSILNR